MSPLRKGHSLVGPTVCDYDHVGRVLAARLRAGPGHIHDVLQRRRTAGRAG